MSSDSGGIDFSKIVSGVAETAAEPWPLAVVKDLMTIAASPGGLAILEKLFVDHGLAPDVVKEKVRQEVRF